MNDSDYERGLLACVHCGLCLNACPTYLETGCEADSPRGRLLLMRYANEGKLALTDEGVQQHLDACLGCRACETACPSGVPYGSLLEVTRSRLNCEPAGPLAFAHRQSIKQFLNVLATPSVSAVAINVSGLISSDSVPPVLAKLLRTRGNRTLSKVHIGSTPTSSLPHALTQAKGKRRYRVGVLAGCVMRVMFGSINEDTIRVLSDNGCEVMVPQSQGCCGALHAHNGYIDAAKEYAKRLIDSFGQSDGLDAIVINSAGCGSMAKELGHLLKDDPLYAESSVRFSDKVRDVSEWLDAIGLTAPLKQLSPLNTTVAYHDACHLRHGQGVFDAPRHLLSQIPGITLVDLHESDICCGSAGIYNFTEPDMAVRLQKRKLNNIEKTGATIVATGNPGCLSWIKSGFVDRGNHSLEVLHPVTLLARALA